MIQKNTHMKSIYFLSTFFGMTLVGNRFIPQELQVKKALPCPRIDKLAAPPPDQRRIKQEFYMNGSCI